MKREDVFLLGCIRHIAIPRKLFSWPMITLLCVKSDRRVQQNGEQKCSAVEKLVHRHIACPHGGLGTVMSPGDPALSCRRGGCIWRVAQPIQMDIGSRSRHDR